jgi:hypothetical protein
LVTFVSRPHFAAAINERDKPMLLRNPGYNPPRASSQDLHRGCLRTAERLVQEAHRLLLSQGFSPDAATAELIGMITAVKLRGDLEMALTGEAA